MPLMLTIPLSVALLVAVTAMQPAAACEDAAPPLIHVVAEPTAVSVAADFSLSELDAMAQRSGIAHQPAPLGFYSSSVLHDVRLQPSQATTAACTDRLQIELDIRLSDRRIEIGREVQQQRCRYTAALAHYQRKAEADRLVFADYVTTVARVLHTTPLPQLADTTDAGSVAADQVRLEHWVEAVVAQHLQALHQARLAAFQAIDTTEEMRRLAEACTRGA